MKTGKSTMTDKISNINGPLNGANIQTTNKSSKESSSTVDSSVTAVSSSSVNQVDISSAQALEKIRESLASEPVVDRQKVELIKQALQDGTYNIDAEKIAAKLIEFEQLLK